MDHLAVKLGKVTVGGLSRRPENTFEFRFASSYLDMRDRPVLGQSFEDDLQRARKTTGRVLPFFSNLLPEGALRDMIARQAKVHEPDEMSLLAYLGQDLPGAVVLERVADALAAEGEPDPDSHSAAQEEPLKFSLAGVQLKFSGLRSGKGVVIPATGRGGDWIVKLPDSRHFQVPANEHSMLIWARESGLQVPEFDLIQISSIAGLPRGIELFEEREALLVRRFDRLGQRRIHIEDFAQVLRLYPDQKYGKHNYETIGRIVRAVAGDEAFLEYARRLAFMVLSGNGDAHHKNWSLIYPDGRSASLSPAYDLVFTRDYLPEDSLALNFDGSKDFNRIGTDSFKRLACRCEFDEASLADEVGTMVERSRAAWTRLESDLPMRRESKQKLRRHLSALQL